MLMIERKLPIQKMAIYGSLAVLIGFTGTYAILNQLFPIDDPNLAGSSLNERDAARANVSNQIPTKDKKDKADKDAAAPLTENGLATREGSVPSQQTLRVAPAQQPAGTSAPSSSSMTVVPAAPTTTGGGGTTSSAPAVSGSTPPSSGGTATPDPIDKALQDTTKTINNTTDTSLLP